MLALRDDAGPATQAPSHVVAVAPTPGPIADAKDHPRYRRVTGSDEAPAIVVTDAKDHPRYRRATD
jgi:hypothetical protein